MITTVTPKSIADELGRVEPVNGDSIFKQWSIWIERADGEIQRRAKRLGVAASGLDAAVVDAAVADAVIRRINVPVDGAESTTDQMSLDDGSLNQTRRYGSGATAGRISDDWWTELGLVEVGSAEWSGSLTYGGR